MNRVVLAFLAILQLVLCAKVPNDNPFADEKTKPKSASIDSHKGVVALDSFTFPKIVPHSKLSTVVFVYQKSEVGSYGTDSYRGDYFSFADRVNTQENSDNILFAQVIVNGAFNLGLATSFGLARDFTAPALFIFPAGASEPVRFDPTQKFDHDSMYTFVRDNSDYIQDIPGVIPALESYISSFYDRVSERTDTIASLLAAELPAKINEYAQSYAKIMSKVIEKGEAHVDAEVKRIGGILRDTKLSAKARAGITSNLNVWKLFQEHQDKRKGRAAAAEKGRESESEL